MTDDPLEKKPWLLNVLHTREINCPVKADLVGWDNAWNAALARPTRGIEFIFHDGTYKPGAGVGNPSNMEHMGLFWVLARYASGLIAFHENNTAESMFIVNKTMGPLRNDDSPYRQPFSSLSGWYYGYYAKQLDKASASCNLKAQVEIAPRILAAHYKFLGQCAEFADTETKRVNGIPTVHNISYNDSPQRKNFPNNQAYEECRAFLDDYYFDNLMTPEPLTRFMMPTGTMQNERTTTGQSFLNYAIYWYFLSVESNNQAHVSPEFPEKYRLNTTSAANYVTHIPSDKTYPFDRHLKRHFQVKGDDLALKEISKWMYDMGLAAQRWGFTKDTTEEEAEFIADKMTRLNDYTLCHKALTLYEKRITPDKDGKYPESNDLLLGWSQEDLDYLKAYEDRLAARRHRGVQDNYLNCELTLCKRIYDFFGMETNNDEKVTLLKKKVAKDPLLTAAGAHTDLEINPAKYFQWQNSGLNRNDEEYKRDPKAWQASYQKKVRQELAGKKMDRA